MRFSQVITNKFNVRVVDHSLNDRAVILEKGGTQWFGFPNHLTNRRFEQIVVNWARNAHKHAQLPPGSKLTCFFGKPNIQLPPR
ncbi:hypothetical protein A5753_07365 [Mycobacterium sp. 852002-51971_SCH5477799-a]|nr:hypothetical protein A5753_07365 [Mycobacterium sp. 852002-51971_SCH5477799-a]